MKGIQLHGENLTFALTFHRKVSKLTTRQAWLFATFLPFDTTDEAAAIANDTQFGLVSYVWSDDLPTVMTMTEQLRSGVVWVNTPMMRELRAPFGGYKNSGVGREGGAACEAFYTEEKTVTLPKTPPPLRRLGETGG